MLQVQGWTGPFPIGGFYRQWNNTEGQVSLFQQILRNPDVFNFVDHSHHPVAVEVMKVAPAEMENREYASWKSLELLDTLLALADAGHSHAVMEMFQVGSWMLRIHPMSQHPSFQCGSYLSFANYGTIISVGLE